MFKTKFISTYSFAKLNRSVDKILRESIDDIGETAGKIMQRNIDDARYAPLRPFTKKMRAKGIGWGGKKVPPTSDETPLKQTGSLYKSLNYIKKDQTIKMNSYGRMHHDGFIGTSGFKVPPRPFMDLQSGKKGFFFNKPDELLPETKRLGLKDPLKNIYKKMKKAFKTK